MLVDGVDGVIALGSADAVVSESCGGGVADVVEVASAREMLTTAGQHWLADDGSAESSLFVVVVVVIVCSSNCCS